MSSVNPAIALRIGSSFPNFYYSLLTLCPDVGLLDPRTHSDLLCTSCPVINCGYAVYYKNTVSTRVNIKCL